MLPVMEQCIRCGGQMTTVGERSYPAECPGCATMTIFPRAWEEALGRAAAEALQTNSTSIAVPAGVDPQYVFHRLMTEWHRK